jgi:hypothetical protein
LRQLSEWLSGVAAQVGRDVNPHVFTPREFSRRRQAGDRFVTSVLGAPRLFVIGTEMSLQEWVELGGLRTHESSRQEIAGVSPTVDSDLRDARERALSPDWAVWEQA